ncbi:MAG: lipopolysaccharide heptosyltransferase II [Candidatus Omnitrophica bacterium]|nr:lipopolysaccharide heptosyltransferase II [Candidatus Omnitrophota bacterium]MBU4472847.1 lipopolysaccharide heptosyltransferase II [Candidatus Omnitrophota bacterium]MCG2706040.1 lipopolysaccharide heptosyltransferase II [Candidatus Omnitrophota bacterium]
MKAKRILIFNVNWLGDVLFSTAVIRNIRHNSPDSFIACIIPSRCYLILKGNPHLDEIILFDEKDRHRNFLEKMRFVQSLKSKKFDMVFLLHRSFSRALIMRLAGIPQIIGYSTKKRAFLLTQKIAPIKRDSLHRIDYYLNIIEKAGLRVEDRYAEFFVSDEDEAFVDRFLNSKSVNKGEFLLGINPGGNWLPKRWPAHYWARLIDRLIAESGFKVIITGSTSDIALVKEIQKSMLKKPILATAELNIKQLGALCRRLDLFITADTGPLHIANAVGTKKIIALFGPTSPLVTGPWPLNNVSILQADVGCKVPCYAVNCKDSRCMKAITPEAVLEEIRKIVKTE